MRLLLDECVDERLRHLLCDHDCQTARHAKLAGLSNGDLLAKAEAASFEVLITVDQNIPYQQNIANRSLALMVLCAKTNQLRDLEKIVPAALRALESIKAGDVIRVS